MAQESRSGSCVVGCFLLDLDRIGPYCSYSSIWVHIAKVSDCIALIALDLRRKEVHLSE
ncbi:hypothetical protein NYE59_22900 [Paenibacillus sp. FSL L8-0323]|uniref:hypothetical protein n=1 Tax=Paenibacillus TaxID=44249 RepID=UPI0012D2BFFB|nr:hypothetical protein [Paenibacillus odorifer]